MAPFDGGWQAVAAAIAAAAAIWQFGGLKDHRRAIEISKLDEVTASAAARKDSLEHAYRAYALQRMQSLHGNRATAGVQVFIWGFLFIGFIILAIASDEPTATGQVVIFVGLMASMMMAARCWNLWLRVTRTLHNELAEAFEVAMVSERRSFIDSSNQLPPLQPYPELAQKAVAEWRAVAIRRRRDIVMLCIFAAVSLAYAALGSHAVRVGWIDLAAFIRWSSLVALAGFAGIPFANPMFDKFIAKMSPPRMRLPLAWMIRITWVVVVAVFGPGLLGDGIIWFGTSTTPPQSLFGQLAVLGSVLFLGILLGLGGFWMAWRRKRLRR